MYRETKEFLKQFLKKNIPIYYCTTKFNPALLDTIYYYEFNGEFFDMKLYYTDPSFTLEFHHTFISEENDEDNNVFRQKCRIIYKCYNEIENMFFKNRKWKHYNVKDWKLFLDKLEKINQKYIKIVKTLNINYKLNKLNEDFENL